jgi:hypothetical protein
MDKGYYAITRPDKMYCPSGVKAASVVKCGEGSRLNPHFCNIKQNKDKTMSTRIKNC